MTEDELQIKVARYLDGLGVLWFHCPNEGKRTRKQGFKLRQKGLKPGVPDILIFNAPREYAREAGGKRPVGIGIELKKPGSSGQTFERYRRWECSALTGAQHKWLVELHNQGWACWVAYSLDEVREILQFHGLDGRVYRPEEPQS
jgi:hypothetical protein